MIVFSEKVGILSQLAAPRSIRGLIFWWSKIQPCTKGEKLFKYYSIDYTINIWLKSGARQGTESRIVYFKQWEIQSRPWNTGQRARLVALHRRQLGFFFFDGQSSTWYKIAKNIDTRCPSNEKTLSLKIYPKGLRAESARTVTGRQCPHSSVGEVFLAHRPGFTRKRL